MIRSGFISAIFSFFLVSCTAQEKNYFEGKITYHYDILSKNPRVDSSKLTMAFGSGSILMFKNGNYRHNYSDGIMDFDIYRKDHNRLYFKMRNNDTIFWQNCGSLGNKIDKFEFTAKKEIVLGINCDELIIYYRDKTISQYYNSDSLRINAEWFKNYTLNDENLIDSRERALYLKTKADYVNFVVIETATKFTKEQIDARTFELPTNAILAEQK